MKSILVACVSMFLLVACDSGSLNVRTTPTQLDVAQVADPAPVQMLPVQFRVVNRNNLDTFLAELRSSQSTDNPVFIAISTQDYENMAINLADLRRYIQQQQSVIVYYRRMTTNNQRQP